MKNLGWAFALFGVVACGDSYMDFAQARVPGENIVVRATAEIEMSTGGGEGVTMTGARFATQSKSKIIIITNPKATTMSLDDSLFTVPVVDSDSEDFGYLAIGDLRDNDLNVCGASGNQKCGKAVIRLYTIGMPGAGLWNQLDGYGIPLTAGLTGPVVVGLGQANAVQMQMITIGPTKRVVRLADFPTPPKYNIKADFSDAGAGDFQTTLVVEYGLAL